MPFARSGIDTPLKVSSMFGVFSGILLISSFVALSVKLGWADYINASTLAFIMSGITYGLFVILGNLVVLYASMNIEPRGVLAFFVFLASVFALLGSLFFLMFAFLGPLRA
jgi:hypothetical protein